MNQLAAPVALTTSQQPGEAPLEISLRPKALAEFVGHDHIKGGLGLILAAAKRRDEPVDHILFHGGHHRERDRRADA